MGKKGTLQETDGRSAVSAAFIEHESFLKRFLKRFLSLPQDIEDVVQETYLKARSAEQGQVINSPKSFLFRIARNEALKELRKKSRHITDYIEDLDAPGIPYGEASAEEEAIAKQRLGIFCQSALEMTPKCRRVFLMCKVYGMSYKAVASQLGITVSTVEKHVSKGLQICNAYVDRMEQPTSSEPPTSAAPALKTANTGKRASGDGDTAFDSDVKAKGS